jgi:DNA-binding LacI/PurR family transcriptional regulator
MPDSDSRPTLRTIAERLGVSRMTVSRALRGERSVSLKTIARVREAALAVGFRPDPKLTELMTYLRENRVRTSRDFVAYVNTFPASESEHRLSQTEERMLAGALARSEALGYGLQVFVMDPRRMPAARLRQIIATRGIAGLIVQASRGDFTGVADLASRFSTCVIGSSQPSLPLHVACNHHPHTMRTALEQLAALGHRRIGYYMTEAIDLAVGNLWHSIFLHHQQSLNLAAAGLDLVVPAWDREGFQAWLRLSRPDAVVTLHWPALAWMREIGLRVPGDASYVHLDWCPSMPPCAGIDQRTEQVGAAAVEIVAGQMLHHEQGVPASQHTVLVKGVWCPGDTAGPLTRAAGG